MRGSTTERGYGGRHQALRESLEPQVRAGEAVCWRCLKPIGPRDEWHLGHDDNDRTKYMGPECVPCNLGQGRSQLNVADMSREW